MRRALLLLPMLSGCTRPPPSPHPSASASGSASASAPALVPAPALAPAPPSAWPRALPTPTLSPRGPIKVAGYPTELRTCLPDPAENAGFTRDGAELGYCVHAMSTRCELVDRAGHTRLLTSRKSDDSPAPDPAKDRAIAAFVKDSGLPALTRHDCTLRPPLLTGTWAYPDIAVNVARIDSSFTKGPSGSDDKLLSQPLVKVGGAVDGEAPVHPLTYSAPHRVMTPPTLGEIPFNVTELNALVLSPDGSELGIVVHANCMEWCDDFQVIRIPAARFASLVYNDAGFRALEKGKLERAVELFTRAAYVDSARELPAYNLACTYARLKDGRAEAALDLAIGRGGNAVRARASKDRDFDAVKSEPWFLKLTTAAPP
jgi:hypothetical protein